MLPSLHVPPCLRTPLFCLYSPPLLIPYSPPPLQVNRLSFQARQDLQVMKNAANSVGQRLGGFASKLMSDLTQGR